MWIQAAVTHLRMVNAACFRLARSFLAMNIRTTLSILIAVSRHQTHTHTDIKKGKVLPYSLPSVGPGADLGVQAVSPQVTLSESCHKPGVG